MSDIKLGNVPSSTLNDTSNLIFTDGENVRKETYANVKADMVGSTDLTTTAQKTKEAINELNQDLLDSTGYGVISGGVVSAQSTPNMTVQVTQCTLKTATGARQTVSANSSLAITVADTTNPRIDIVYADSTGAIQYIQGTAASSPTAPSTPTGGFLLYEVNVVANATSITNSDIVDKRKIKNTTDLLATELSDKVNKTAIVNNATTTQEGFALDARQGKIYQDQINKMGLLTIEKTIKVNTANVYYSESPIDVNSSYMVIIKEYYDENSIAGSAMYLVQTPLNTNLTGNALQLGNNLPVALNTIGVQGQGYLQINFASNIYAKIGVYKLG